MKMIGVQKKTVGPDNFALPPFDDLVGAVVIQLDEPRNLVVLVQTKQFRDGNLSLNWDAIREIAQNPNRVLTIDVSSSAWVYQCCDYAVGLILGMLGKVTGKRFREQQIDLPFSGDGEPSRAQFYAMV